MTIHTLEKEKHKEFLAQKRIDPITGDLLQENDKLVFFQFRTVKESEAVNIFAGLFALIGCILEIILYFSLDVDFFGLGLSIVFLGWAIGKAKYQQKTLILDSGQYIINKNKKKQIILESKEIQSIKAEKAKFFSKLANSILFNKEEDFYNLVFTTNYGTTHKVFISELELKRIDQETNILKKYTNSQDNQIPIQNAPLITPPNNRLDLDS